MFKWFKSGSPWIWLTSGAVSISLLSVLGLLLLIGWKGLSYFWPAPLYQWQTDQGEVLIGQIYEQQSIPISHLREMDVELPEEIVERGLVERVSIKVANRELYSADFVSLLEVNLNPPTRPQGWAVIERTRDGDFFGRPVGYVKENGQISREVEQNLAQGLAFAKQIRRQIEDLIEDDIRTINAQAQRLRLEHRKRSLNNTLDDAFSDLYHKQSEQYHQALIHAEAPT